MTDGLVLVQDGDGVVHAFEPDGDVAWQSRSRRLGTSPLAAAHGVVLTLDGYEILSALDTADGRQLWTRHLPPTRTTPAIVGEEVVLVSRKGEVQVLDLADGSRVDGWELPLPASDSEWFVDVAPALVDDTLVLSAFAGGDLTNSVLFAYPVTPDAPAGRTLSLTSRAVPGIPTEPPVLVGEDLVVPTYDLLAKVGADGGVTQLIGSVDQIQTGATVSDGVVVARNGDQMQGIGLDTGKALWRVPAGDSVFGAVPAANGSTAFFGVADQGLSAVDLHSGQVRWKARIADQYAAASPLILPDGDVLYGGGGLARYAGDTGRVEWRDPEAHLFGSAAYAGGVVYATSLSPTDGSGALSAFDAATGVRLWSRAATEPPLYIGTAVAEGVVVAVDGHVASAHDARDGRALWSVDLGRDPAATPVIADGHVFLVAAGNGHDLDDDGYRVSVHDLRTGRFLSAWEPDATPITQVPHVGATADGRLLMPTSLTLAVVEAR